MLSQKSKQLQLIPVFLFLFLITFATQWGVLGLSLYGDDWYIISAYFGELLPKYGPFNPNVYLTNYGFQNLLAIFYSVIKLNYPFYYAISLLFRVIAATGIYYLVNKLFSFKQALISSALFVIIAVGYETTVAVFMLSVYLGIFTSLYGLAKLIYNRNHDLVSILFVYVGFVLSPIRLYVPLLLLPLYLFVNLLPFKINKLKELANLISKIIIVLIPLFLIKRLYPNLGINSTYTGLVQNGISRIFEGGGMKILSIFTNMGQMLLPQKLLDNVSIVSIYSANVIFTSIIVIVVMSLFIIISLQVKLVKKMNIIFSLCFILFFTLSYFTNRISEYSEFGVTAWTYIGIITTFILFAKLFKRNSENVKVLFKYNFTVIFFIYSFIFPWLAEPGFLYNTFHRYLIVSAIGISLFIGEVLTPSLIRDAKLILYVKVFLVVLFCLLQLKGVNKYIGSELAARSSFLSDKLMSQVAINVPSINHDEKSVFYFYGFDDNVYDSLLRFGFGYRMQILYEIPYKSDNHPYSTNNFDELKEFIARNGIKEENVYALKLNKDKIVDITEDVRSKIFINN